MKKVSKRMGAILIILIAGFSLCFIGISTKAETINTVYEGIYIEDVALGGMTKECMTEIIGTYVDTILNKPITLQMDDGVKVCTSLKKVGCIWTNPEVIEEAYLYGRQGNLIERFKQIQDVKEVNMQGVLTFSMDENMAKEFVESNFLKYNKEPIDAIFERKKGKAVITPEIQGKKLNEEVTLLALKEQIEKNWKNETHYTDVSFDILEAKGTENEFIKMVDVLGSFTTSYETSTVNRSLNVENGCNKIDGTFLYPGESISVYEKCHPFNYANGYFDGGAYLDGIVIGSVGGGICQVATTLYNAALRSEVKILERQPHSMIVSYVNQAEDSALSGTYKDLKFENTLEHPIYIEGVATEDRQITFTIYGIDERAEDRELSFFSEIISEIVPTTERIVQDLEFPVGYAQTQSLHIGYDAKLWKIVSIGGVETERIFVNESKYMAAPRTLIVGTGGASPEILAAIAVAAATGSIEEVKAVVATIVVIPVSQ
jgi:vancomycin resistance protein YoaR